MKTIFALLLFVLSTAAGASAAEKHPVQQLVEWELTANSEMKLSSLQRMATSILGRIEARELPASAKGQLDLAVFRGEDADAKAAAVAQLTEAQLKEIVVLPAPIDYFEVSEARLQKLGTYNHHELVGFDRQRAALYLKFQKNGQNYFRWPVHPLAESSKSAFKALYEETFEEKLTARRGFLRFHFTSSRSLLLFTSNYDAAESLKLSLPASEGPFKSKAIHLKEYTAWSRHNLYLNDVLKKVDTPYLKLQREAFGVGVGFPNTGEDALLFRSVGDSLGRGFYLIPAFSVLNETVGAEIALRNGSKDPLAFWEEHLLKPMAFGLAELRAYSGAEHTSPHSQNLLVELDENFKPTGKLVLRDFDFYVDKSVFDKLNRTVENSDGLVRDGTQHHLFALRNGLRTLPKWMSDKDYSNWVSKYLSLFSMRFSQITGIGPTVGFDSKKIKVHSGWSGWLDMKDGAFTTGGKNNFHGIAVANPALFNSLYSQWLSDRVDHTVQWKKDHPEQEKTEMKNSAAVTVVESTPQTPVAPAHGLPPFGNWQTLLSLLSRASNVDSFEGRTGNIGRDFSLMNLRERKEAAQERSKFSLTEKFRTSTNPRAILELAKMDVELDPSLLSSAELAAFVRRANGTAAEIETAETLERRIREHTEQVRLLRQSPEDTLLADLAKPGTPPKAFVSVTDALAFRLKRTQNSGLQKALAVQLARVGGDDAVVRGFLDQQTLAPHVRWSVEQVQAGRPLKAVNSCRDIF